MTDITWSVAQINNQNTSSNIAKMAPCSYPSESSQAMALAPRQNMMSRSIPPHPISINYYRIKQVDYDSKYSLSDKPSVRYSGASNITIYSKKPT